MVMFGGLGVAFLLALLVLFVVPMKIKKDLREEVTRDVIRQLQRTYVPGPYAPGYDPDKVDVGAFQPQPQRRGYQEFR